MPVGIDLFASKDYNRFVIQACHTNLKMVLAVNNRELLRNYKSIKERLRLGQIKKVTILQEDGFELVLTGRKVKGYKTAFESLVEDINNAHLPKITRNATDLFDDR
jgi:hypothetical protein